MNEFSATGQKHTEVVDEKRYHGARVVDTTSESKNCPRHQNVKYFDRTVAHGTLVRRVAFAPVIMRYNLLLINPV